jgi:hypothetical protein
LTVIFQVPMSGGVPRLGVVVAGTDVVLWCVVGVCSVVVGTARVVVVAVELVLPDWAR